MLQAYHAGFREYYYGYTNTTSEIHKLHHNHSLKIGYQDTTIKQRQRNTRHAHHVVMYAHTILHDSRRNT